MYLSELVHEIERKGEEKERESRAYLITLKAEWTVAIFKLSH